MCVFYRRAVRLPSLLPEDPARGKKRAQAEYPHRSGVHTAAALLFGQLCIENEVARRTGGDFPDRLAFALRVIVPPFKHIALFLKALQFKGVFDGVGIVFEISDLIDVVIIGDIISDGRPFCVKRAGRFHAGGEIHRLRQGSIPKPYTRLSY